MQGMWKHVWSKVDILDDRDNAAKRAISAGYKFMAFNGLIFFLSVHDRQITIEDTGIFQSELEGDHL